MKIAQELGLSEAEHAALVLVLEKLEAGRLRHTTVKDAGLVPMGDEWFTMSWWVIGHGGDCGTAACIGGWAERLGKVVFGDTECRSALDDLFYPPTKMFPSYDMITVEMAARALRNYLETGAARWEEVR